MEGPDGGTRGRGGPPTRAVGGPIRPAYLMPMKFRFTTIGAMLLWLAAPLLAAPQLSYEITAPGTEPGCFDVVARWREVPEGPAQIAFSGYALGTHAHRNYARHVAGMQAKRDGEWVGLAPGAEGRTWPAEVGPGGELELRYTVRAADTHTSRGFCQAFIDAEDDEAYFLPSALCAYPRDTRPAEGRLKLAIPPDWQVATSLPESGSGYATEPFGRLLDEPVQLGRFDTQTFTVGDKRFRIVFAGRGALRQADFATAVKDIARVELGMFPSAPFDDYLFVTHFGRYLGGLEHERSCTMCFDRDDRSLTTPTLIAAHELFHAWNGRAVYPEGWGPGRDPERLTPNSALWIYEGLTVYFTDVIMWRAGVRSEDDFRAAIAEYCTNTLNALRADDARALETLCRDALRSSLEFNTSIFEVYDRGFVTGLLLDLRIRHETEGRKSLADVMRWLLAEYGEKHRGYPDDVLWRAVREATGVDIDGLLNVLVRSLQTPPLQEHLRWGGWDFRAEEEIDPSLGVFTEGAASARVVAVEPRGPAARAGISRGDVIVSVGGREVASRGQLRLALTQQARSGNRTFEVRVRRGEEVLAFRGSLPTRVRCSVKPLRGERRQPLEARRLFDAAAPGYSVGHYWPF